MKTRNIIRLSLIVAILFLGFVIYVEYDHQLRVRGVSPISEYVNSDVLGENTTYDIEAVRIRTQPNYFEIKIENIGWIRAYLSREYRDQAKIPLINLFHSCEKPVVILKENREVYWIVDINLTVDGEKINLFDWLSDRDLIFR